MFFHYLFVICSALHAYVFWRMASVPILVRSFSRRTILSTGALLWLLYVVGQVLENSDHTLFLPLQFFAANWTGVLVLLSLCLFVIDVLTGFGYLWPRVATALRGYALLAGCVLSAIALYQGMRAPVVRTYDVSLPGLPPDRDGTVLVVASDFHLGTFLGKSWLSARVAQINAERPDAIVLAGDIVEGHGGSDNLLAVIRQLSAPLGVWAVNGNHEGYGRSGRDSRLLEDAGFHVLHDTWGELKPGLLIAGVDDLTSRRHRGEPDVDSVERALKGRPPAPTVFISHTPWQMERAARLSVGLMLSAHTHGGQLWPFTYVVGFRYPLYGGRYTVAGMPLIVCRGTGTWGPRMRLWHPSEILRITLRSAPAAIKNAVGER